MVMHGIGRIEQSIAGSGSVLIQQCTCFYQLHPCCSERSHCYSGLSCSVPQQLCPMHNGRPRCTALLPTAFSPRPNAAQ